MSSPRTLLLALCLSTTALAQTLARPGWAGSGMSAEPWWKHAVIYQLDPRNFSNDGLKGIPTHLDYLQSLGVDAILLTNTAPDDQNLDPALGTIDDLDDLIHQASRHNIRILLDLKSTPDLTSAARSWLNRGIAGFYTPNPADAATLRKATGTYVGQRIVLTDLAPETIQNKQQNHDSAPQLVLDPRAGTQPQLTASTIRPALESAQNPTQSQPLLLTDGPTYPRSMTRYADGKHDLDIAKVLAATLLTTRAATLLYNGQELGLTTSEPAPIHWEAPPAPPKGQPAPTPDATPNAALEETDPRSLLNWYRQLSSLHHGNATISSGASITLNHDDQNILAWVRKPANITAISPPIVVICNLSAQPVQLSLKEDMQRLRLKGSFLRTILRSDNGLGPMHLDSMTIPPYAVYIGELRY